MNINKIEICYFVTKKTNLKKIIKLGKINRFYLGDQECDHNFIYLLNQSFFKKILFSNKKTTIVVPHLNNKNSDIFIDFLFKNKDKLNKLKDLEFVINEYSIIHIINKYIKNVLYVNGAYLNKQERDIHIDKNDDKKAYIRGDTSSYNEFMNKLNINSLDLFNTKQGIKINYINKKNNLFYPIIVVGFTKYCYTYHLRNKLSELSVVEKCDGCKKNEYNFYGNIGDEKHTYSGNKYTYKSYTLRNLLSKKNNIDRIIYNYDLI